MKKLIFVCSIFSINYPLYSLIRYELKGGANYPISREVYNLHVFDSQYPDINVDISAKYDPKFSFNFGLGFDHNIFDLSFTRSYFQVNYLRLHHQITSTIDNPISSLRENVTLNHYLHLIQIPFGLSFYTFLNHFINPYVSCGVFIGFIAQREMQLIWGHRNESDIELTRLFFMSIPIGFESRFGLEFPTKNTFIFIETKILHVLTDLGKNVRLKDHFFKGYFLVTLEFGLRIPLD